MRDSAQMWIWALSLKDKEAGDQGQQGFTGGGEFGGVGEGFGEAFEGGGGPLSKALHRPFFGVAPSFSEFGDFTKASAFSPSLSSVSASTACCSWVTRSLRLG